jgi:hypothetical protein
MIYEPIDNLAKIKTFIQITSKNKKKMIFFQQSSPFDLSIYDFRMNFLICDFVKFTRQRRPGFVLIKQSRISQHIFI